MNRCSASLAIREMQTKTTPDDHCTPLRIAEIEKSKHQVLARSQRNWVTQSWGGNKRWYSLSAKQHLGAFL
jgi:hypothetical protein